MKKEFICIVCPRSCRLHVEKNGEDITVVGNACSRGEVHGIKEFTNPERMLTTTVAFNNGMLSRLPVIGTSEIPKAKIKECLEYLYSLRIEAPVECRNIIVKNICETGVDIIATRSIKRKED